MEYNIVPLQACHVSQLAELEQAIFSDPWPAAAFDGELENPLSLWLAAEDAAGRVLGYIGSQMVPPEADMMNLAVREDARRLGLGRALTERLVSELQSRSIESLFLEVRDSNAPAIRLYEKLGFIQVGLRKKYYFHPVEDARILKKELTV